MTITRYAIIYGLLIGAVICATIMGAIALFGHNGNVDSLWFGYLVMLVGMAFVFVGVKRYRDIEKGGVIRFWPALGLGFAIAFVALIAYAAAFEIYLALTHYTFFDTFAATELQRLKEAGASTTAIAEKAAEMDQMRAMVANPFQRFLLIMSEPVPVAVLVPLISAALLRNPKVLPAR